MIRFRYLAIFLVLAIVPLLSQAPNKRLILKDGSYQITRRYEVVGDRVRYISAERAGQWEELPSSLVDWVATEKWARDHAPGTADKANADASPGSQAAAEIDKEEQQERMEENLRMPTVAPGLRLPDEDGVWALDTFHAQPELVRVDQNNGDVNRDRAHNMLRSTLNPLGGLKSQIRIDGARSKVQLHVNDPVLYVSLDTDQPDTAPTDALTVETNGAGSSKHEKGQSSPSSRYAIVRAQTRKDVRVIGSVNVSALGKVSHSEDVIETTAEILPGKHWMKLTPRQPLDIGEYALMEIVSPKEVNLSVWDFRIDPTAPENLNARMPVQPLSGNSRP
ncbi:MAG TPA: hypothetical protein VM554_07765 [Acidisarcina sp.]|nr:hypothetical protein [Acidisarcina sp.]